jgi:hypothetical protein
MKIVRSGRHTQPSQVEKVAEKAGKAAPVMAISAGALVAVPHGHAAPPVKHGTVAEAVTTAKTQSSAVSAGQALVIAKATNANSTSLNTAGPTTSAVTTSYQAKHAKTVQSSAGEAQAHTAHLAHLAHLASEAHAAHLANEAHSAHLAHLARLASETQSASAAHSAQLAASEAHAAHLAHLAHVNGQHTSSPASHSSTTTVSDVSHSAAPTSSGSYSCSGLESLWKEAGGSSGEAFMAAEIAMAESGGNPNAVSPTDDFGLWQINGSHGALATLNPLGNARAAVSVSSNGSNWGAWTTYTSGAYSGKC